MNQAELTTAISAITGLPKKAVSEVLTELGHQAAAELFGGGEVTLPGLGKLKSHTRAAREGRNPATGEPVRIPARHTAKLVPAKALKDALNP